MAWNGTLSQKKVSRGSSHGGEEDYHLHFAFSNRLREIEGWRSKEQEENPRLGWDSLFLKKLQEEEEREMTPPYIEI